ncbi:hypothetical protein TBK1r_55070 [Stieleria magnilauensis]|uniref:Uncharacterized protein n=1 Tax=Stieleria magnilauensis TaxID=2527963 RepID=A0ABX5XWU0_9BACT|nr:hypothetical protein TBK1r_55070 [Planctomycetes bacterium TBK1r]
MMRSQNTTVFVQDVEVIQIELGLYRAAARCPQ